MTERFLTSNEIDYILDDFDSYNLTSEQNLCFANIIKAPLIKSLKLVEIDPVLIDELKEIITKDYRKSRIQSGTVVGIIAGQVLGQTQTQSVLNSFHSAGLLLANVVTGVPRFTELLLATKKPKGQNTEVFFNQAQPSITNIRNVVGCNMKHLTLNDLVVKHKIQYKINFSKTAEPCVNSTDLVSNEVWDSEENFYEFFNQYYEEYFRPNFMFNESNVRLRLFLNRQILFEFKITPKMIVDKLLEIEDIDFIFSPPHLCFIDIFPDMSKMEEQVGFSSKNTRKSKEINEYIFIEQNIWNKMKLNTILGINGIKQIIYKKDDRSVEELRSSEIRLGLEPGGLQQIQEDSKQKNNSVSETNRVSLRIKDSIDELESWTGIAEGDVFPPSQQYALSVDRFINILSFDFVDVFLTKSNNMWDIYNVYGVEAAREFLIDEFIQAVTDDPGSINRRHIELLVDTMTNLGIITPVRRNGITKKTCGVLTRASFETVYAQFTNAALYTLKDPIVGVSASIICGRTIEAGSNMSKLVFDHDKMIEMINQNELNTVTDTDIGYTKYYGDQEIDDESDEEFETDV
ncbi:MAG: hypothetical protein JKX76_02515 [Colwellia sp.]|nr:hypothetical protein [Colwellia sp.]